MRESSGRRKGRPAPPPGKELPAEFVARLEELEESYLKETDPIRQSGFGGGTARWRAERGAILEAIEGAGEILDVGCANGYLLECLVKWAAERGVSLVPYGADAGPRLIELARARLPQFADNFFIANGWDWTPSRRFRYVYSLYDCVPEGYLAEYVGRLLALAVAPGGRLILGAYGSRSQGYPPFEIEAFLRSAGYEIAGTAAGGDPPITSFAWIDKNEARR